MKSKPVLSAAFWLLAVLALVGLAALFLAADHAFGQVMPWYQAMFAALLIEAGMVSEAVALARGRNWLAAAGMGISLVVSGTYNYIQVAAVGQSLGLAGWPLFALALGPLFALSFLALAIGQELRMYEALLADWQADQDVQAAQEAQQAAQGVALRQAWLDEQERLRQAAALEHERAQQAALLERQRLEVEAHERVELARVRAEARQAQRAAQPVAQPVARAKQTIAGDGLPQLQGNRLRVLELARNATGATQQEIAQQLGITRQAVGKHLAALKEAGLLNGNGHKEMQ